MSVKINLLLTALLFGCALLLVKSQYQSRNLFIELGKLEAKARQLDIDWAQLQLDQSTLGKNARIEQIARTELNMAPLTPARTQYLTEGGQ
jgi:cell division protein FtsL